MNLKNLDTMLDGVRKEMESYANEWNAKVAHWRAQCSEKQIASIDKAVGFGWSASTFQDGEMILVMSKSNAKMRILSDGKYIR